MGDMGKNRRKIGTAYENQAVLFLEQKGYRIIERNYTARQGEIDLVAQDGEYLVFIEVKSRSGGEMGAALEAVTPAKQRKIIHTARSYLCRRGYSEWTPCRFDVLAFEGGKIYHIENAFEAGC